MTLQWFKEGLSTDELKKAYRELAKQYHPDISNDPNATEIMKEINEEYDKYYVITATGGSVSTNGVNNWWYRRSSNTNGGYANSTIHKWVSEQFRNMWSNWAEEFHKANEEARKNREKILLFLIRDKVAEAEAGDGKIRYVGYSQAPHYHPANRLWGIQAYMDYGPKFVGTGDGWQNNRSGLHYVKTEVPVDELRNKDIAEITDIPATKIQVPTLFDLGLDIAKDFDSRDLDYWIADEERRRVYGNCHAHDPYTHIKTKNFGEMWVVKKERNRDALWFTVAAKVGDEILTAVMRDKWLGPYEELETLEERDVYVKGVLGPDATFEEFYHQYDFNYHNQFDNALRVERLWSGNDFYPYLESPVVEQWGRHGWLTLYHSTVNRRMVYGSINANNVLKHLYEINLDDLGEVQDYLDDINQKYEDSVRSMIKKGKLKINI